MEVREAMERAKIRWDKSEKPTAVPPTFFPLWYRENTNIFMATGQLLAGDDQLGSSGHFWPCSATQELGDQRLRSFVGIGELCLVNFLTTQPQDGGHGALLASDEIYGPLSAERPLCKHVGFCSQFQGIHGNAQVLL